MKLHGHEDLSQYVVSAHIAGMFAFAPLVGRTLIAGAGCRRFCWAGVC